MLIEVGSFKNFSTTYAFAMKRNIWTASTYGVCGRQDGTGSDTEVDTCQYNNTDARNCISFLCTRLCINYSLDSVFHYDTFNRFVISDDAILVCLQCKLLI